MGLTACTVVSKTTIGQRRFVSAIPRNFVSSTGGNLAGTAQVACVYKQRIRIRWNCCNGITTFTFGWRWEVEDAGVTSTLPVISVQAPIPGKVAQAFGGVGLTAAVFWADAQTRRTANSMCTGNGALLSSRDVFDTVFANCDPWWGNPYIEYPWGAKQEIKSTPSGGRQLGPIVSFTASDAANLVHEALTSGELVMVSNDPRIEEILEEKENGAEYEKPRVTVRQIPKKTERLVISRLNRINSEKRLAKIIEIPGRRDVGINVAHNIITQKKKLGKFTTIDEIYNVKGVGPQRLNDIVLSLSKKRLG